MVGFNGIRLHIISQWIIYKNQARTSLGEFRVLLWWIYVRLIAIFSTMCRILGHWFFVEALPKIAKDQVSGYFLMFVFMIPLLFHRNGSMGSACQIGFGCPGRMGGERNSHVSRAIRSTIPQWLSFFMGGIINLNGWLKFMRLFWPTWKLDVIHGTFQWINTL